MNVVFVFSEDPQDTTGGHMSKEVEMDFLPPAGSQIFFSDGEDDVGIALEVYDAPAFYPERNEVELKVTSLLSETHAEMLEILRQAGWDNGQEYWRKRNKKRRLHLSVNNDTGHGSSTLESGRLDADAPSQLRSCSEGLKPEETWPEDGQR